MGGPSGKAAESPGPPPEDKELEEIRRRMLGQLRAAARKPEPATSRPVALGSLNFGEFVRTHRQAVVDFWATWCGPCQRFTPVLEATAAELAGRVAFGAVDSDRETGLAAQYGVQSIPTVLVFREGRLVDRWAGAVDRAGLRDRLGRSLDLRPPADAE